MATTFWKTIEALNETFFNSVGTGVWDTDHDLVVANTDCIAVFRSPAQNYQEVHVALQGIGIEHVVRLELLGDSANVDGPKTWIAFAVVPAKGIFVHKFPYVGPIEALRIQILTVGMTCKLKALNFIVPPDNIIHEIDVTKASFVGAGWTDNSDGTYSKNISTSEVDVAIFSVFSNVNFCYLKVEALNFSTFDYVNVNYKFNGINTTSPVVEFYLDSDEFSPHNITFALSPGEFAQFRVTVKNAYFQSGISAYGGGTQKTPITLGSETIPLPPGLGTAALHNHGEYLHVASSLSDILDPLIARNNLGLGVAQTPQFLDVTYSPSPGSGTRGVADKGGEKISVKDFGAVGNNLNDDTVAIQNAANIARILNRTLYFPAGSYIVSSTITFTGYFSIEGDGIHSCILCTHTGAAFTFNINGVSGTIDFWNITNLQFRGPSSTNVGSCALRFIGDNQALIQYGYCNVWSMGFNSFLKDEKLPRTTGFGQEGMLNWNVWEVRCLAFSNYGFWLTQGSGTGNIYSGIMIPRLNTGACFFFDGSGCVVGDVIFSGMHFGNQVAGGTGISIGASTAYRAQWNLNGLQFDANCDIPIKMHATGAQEYINWSIPSVNWGGSANLGTNLQPLKHSYIVDRDVSDWKAGVAKTVAATTTFTQNCFTVNFATYGCGIFDVYVSGLVQGIAPCASYYQFQIRNNAGAITVVSNAAIPGFAGGWVVTVTTAGAVATIVIGATPIGGGSTYNATVRASGDGFKITRIP